MINKEPLVTVGIPTYNRAKELKKALDSVINQTYKNLEIIISDNCSEDPEVEKICREYVQRDRRIKYFRQEKSLGIGGNGQFLINNASGTFCFILNDDDWISENFLEEGVKTFLTYEDCSLVYGETRLYDTEYNMIAKTCFHDLDDDDYLNRLFVYIENAMKYRLAIALFRTDELKSIKEYEKNRFCEDQIFMCKMLYFGKFKVLNNICFHKLNNGSTKDLETLKKSFNLPPDMTYEGLLETRILMIIEAILYDDFFAQKMERLKIIELALNLHEKLFLAKNGNNTVGEKLKNLRTKFGL